MKIHVKSLRRHQKEKKRRGKRASVSLCVIYFWNSLWTRWAHTHRRTLLISLEAAGMRFALIMYVHSSRATLRELMHQYPRTLHLQPPCPPNK